MKASLTITGMDDYFSALEKAEKDINTVSREALAEVGAMLQSEMIGRVPSGKGINTEKLKSVIKIKTPTVEGNYNYVFVGVIHDLAYTDAGMAIHANIVEFGSVHTQAHPFIRPAVSSKRGAVRSRVQARLRMTGLID